MVTGMGRRVSRCVASSIYQAMCRITFRRKAHRTSDHPVTTLSAKLIDEEITGLSAAKGWQKVRGVGAQRRAERGANKSPEICFTGFNGNDREELKTVAVTKGYKVRITVTKTLDILVLGEASGSKKIEKSEE